MTTTYIPTSQIANDPAGILWLEKRGGQPGKTTIEDIKDALNEYKSNFNAGNVSKAEILTLHRAFPDSPTFKQAAVGIQKMDMVDPLVIGGPASVEMIDREGHLITTGALNKAFQKFMDNQRTRNVMVLHSDVQVGWALPAYISKGGQIFKSGVGDNGLFFICELRDDTAIAKKVADQINQGVLKSYSIAGSAIKIQNMKKGETPYMQVDEMELAEVTICEKGVNQGANFELLKAELPQTGKVDKDQCGYRDATAPEMKMGINCGHCKYFNAETRTCDVVVGDIMPGDYCRLFEQTEAPKPRTVVHRKIIIMHKDDTGRINFKNSFLDWMAKEHKDEDPLKSGKSFTTLNNFAGREAEHHRLLQEYGFPSEQPLDSMRYIPVVETETDDDGKPINIIPPWVVNEAGQDLGDKLDEDAPSFKKAMDILDEILLKANRRGDSSMKRRHTKAPKRFRLEARIPKPRNRNVGDADIDNPTQDTSPENSNNPRLSVDKANGTPQPPPRNSNPNITEQTPAELGRSMGVGNMPPLRTANYQATPESKVPGSVPGGQPPATGRTPEGLQTDYGPQGTRFRGQRSFSPTPEQPEKRPGLLQRLGQQFRGRGTDPTAKPSSEQPPTGGSRKTDRPIPQAVQDRARKRGWQKVGRQAGEAFEGGRPERERLGENIRSGTKRMGELFGRGKERAKAGMKEARAQLGDVAAGWRGDEIAGESRKYRMDKDPETGKRTKVDLARGRTAYKLGRLGRRGGERGVAGAKAGARGAKEFGAGVGEGFTSYDRDARTFDREKAGGGASRGARRIGRMFGATGRGTGEAIGEGTRMAAQEGGRFGRGVARGAQPGQAGVNRRDAERQWTWNEDGGRGPQRHGYGPGQRRSASERFGQWLGGQGRERGADVRDTTGQTARGFGRGLAPGEWGKRLRADEAANDKDRTWGEKLGQFAGVGARGAGRQAGNVGTRAGRVTPRFGSRAREQAHMMNNEGVGRGITFQPSAHRGASLTERHQLATGLANRINAGENLSPKEWMQVVHHMGQSKEGERFAHFSDININHSDWNKPISFSDMKQHLERMNVSHGTHGDGGKRAYDNLVNKLDRTVSNKERLEFDAPNIKDEGPTSKTNWNEEEKQRDTRRDNGDRRQRDAFDEERRKRQGPRPPRREMEDAVIMNSYGGPKVTDTFKRAFKVNI